MNSFVGQIVPFALSYDPTSEEGSGDWMICDGTLLPVSQYQPLFSILTNRFGGDGMTTFALPNLVGRSAMGTGSSSTGGHPGDNALGSTGGAPLVLSNTPIGLPVSPAADAVSVAALGTNGGAVGAFVALRYCICVNGVYPPR